MRRVGVDSPLEVERGGHPYLTLLPKNNKTGHVAKRI
jgi:hypothetical protein